MGTASVFRLASNPRIGHHRVGREDQPLIAIDGVMEDAGKLVDFARSHGGFTDVMAGLYPGLRAPLPLDYARAAVGRLDPLIREIYDLGAVKLVKIDCVYSLVTTPPSALVPFQRIPHIDTSNPLHFAVLHFLCGPPFGGTAFFRQRETGFETITPERAAIYEKACGRSLADDEAAACYIADGHQAYERIALFDARWDRMLVYRSNALHSGHIPDPAALSADPAIGRLTANIFIGYRPA